MVSDTAQQPVSREAQMSLEPTDERMIPEETVRVAHAAFPKGGVYMRMRDALGPISIYGAVPCAASSAPTSGSPGWWARKVSVRRSSGVNCRR